MKTTLESQELIESPKRQTLLLQTNTWNSSIQIPKQINWKAIRLPNRWLLENLVPTPKVENNASSNVSYITQKTNGTIGISFQPFRRYFFQVSESSSSKFYPMIERNISSPRHSLSKLKSQCQWINKGKMVDTQLEWINKGKMIDTHFYSVASASITNNNNPYSPTQSQTN